MKILYFDCFAGISGDMAVGALLELGVPLDYLREQLACIPLPHSSYSIGTEQANRRGIAATRFLVHVEEHQPHRTYTDIAGMLEQSPLAERVKEQAQRIFFRLAEAEARVHGVEIGRVHFHEVGAVDSIIDIAGVAICLDYLGIDGIHASPLPYGSGFVETAHGRLPVPPPATAELMRGMPVHFDAGPGERVTPTGAAILAALATGFGRPPAMHVSAVGCGAGTKEFPDIPNVLRLVMGEKSVAIGRDSIYVVETHIDDMNPEILGFLMEQLLSHGALDVAFSPLQMKKNRPGVRLTLLSPQEKLDALARLVLAESTAIGVRYYPAERFILERSVEERETSLGRVRIKVLREEGRLVRVVPEYEECRRLAAASGLPLIDVYRLVERETAGR